MTPAIVAPSSADLAIRNYGNAGGLSISNTTGAVSIADSLKLGGGRMFEHNNGSFRAHYSVHDVGVNFAVSSSNVPAFCPWPLRLAPPFKGQSLLPGISR